MGALDLDAIEARDKVGFGLTQNERVLIAEVRKLREVVLRDHRPPATLNDFCMECSGEWPCPSAQAAGAT